MAARRNKNSSGAIEESYEKVLLYSHGARLVISSKYLPMITAGTKRSTIRDGVRVFPHDCSIRLGFSPGTNSMNIVVKAWEVKKMKSLTDRDARDDGFTTREALVSQLRQYYPMMNEESIVTIIRFHTAP